MIVKKVFLDGRMHIQYGHKDAKIIKKRFSVLESETVDKLCQWLKENKKTIDAIDCYDPQSGWSGTEFKIGNADLSMNGYCLRNSSVEEFINGEQNPNWYSFYQPEYAEAVKWKENH